MAKLKSRLHYLLALIIPTFGMTSNILADDEPKAAGSEEKLLKGHQVV